MKKILKQYMMAIVAVMLVVGFSAFKVVENSSTAPQDGWYDVTIDPLDPDNESKQTLSSSLGDTPPNIDEFNCAISNSGDRCSIYLTFHGATSVPATVAAAKLDTLNITVGDDANMPGDNN